MKRPHVIVIGNEKGGCGKTTTSIHITMALLYYGYQVSSIDIDARQRSFTNFIENRRRTIQSKNILLPMPSHFVLNKSKVDAGLDARNDEKNRFIQCIKRAAEGKQFIIIDAPGNDTYLSRLSHSFADTIITPINDSFIDLDVVAKINPETFKVDMPGLYSEMIWEAKLYRAKRSRGEIDWILMRNRLSHIDAKNKQNMVRALNNVSRRLGCKLAVGFSERVIYRELFLKGLSLLDVLEDNVGIQPKVGHIKARQELREFVKSLNLHKKVPGFVEQVAAREATLKEREEALA
jgi:chromosome partitioning protein